MVLVKLVTLPSVVSPAISPLLPGAHSVLAPLMVPPEASAASVTCMPWMVDVVSAATRGAGCFVANVSTSAANSCNSSGSSLRDSGADGWGRLSSAVSGIMVSPVRKWPVP
jgi:hypothetical protein